mmetsp:Transcript_8921/g.21164  ORF Transcript_8921/g.21164 Transcript_8921/m.21164 type:complete len:239 (+) Transcript_8921:72-788(+)
MVWQLFACLHGQVEPNTEILTEVERTPECEFVITEKGVAKDNPVAKTGDKVDIQRSLTTDEGSERSRVSGSSEASSGFSFLKADSHEFEDPPRDKEAEHRERRRREEEEARAERRAAHAAARAEAERRRACLEIVESERVVTRFLRQHGFLGVNSPKRSLLGRQSYPLHKAAELGNARLVRMLLREGAIPKLLDSSGRTAVAVAQRRDRNGSHAKVLAVLTAPSAAASPYHQSFLGGA